MISSNNDHLRPQQTLSSSNRNLLATSVASHSLTHPLWRHSIQNMKLLQGSSATAAAVTIASISALPTKISLPTQFFLLHKVNDENDLLPTPMDSSDSVASASLPTKLIGDVAVAVAVTFGVSPFLTVVDKAIVESANGTKPILASARDSMFRMIRHPVQYIKSPTFLLMWAVYSATYSTANAFKTLEEHQSHRKATSTKPSPSTAFQLGKVGTFLGTTMVNSGASILKDRAYARMFSSASAPTSFPKTTYAMWMMRDLSVIGSSFILPDIVSTYLVQEYSMDASKAQSLCQLTLPVAAQFVAGPFHFLGLDFFNRQQSVPTMDRARALCHGLGPVVAARIARIAPGYGIGGVWNTKLRTAWRDEVALWQQTRQHQGVGETRDELLLAPLMTRLGGERIQGTLS